MLSPVRASNVLPGSQSNDHRSWSNLMRMSIANTDLSASTAFSSKCKLLIITEKKDKGIPLTANSYIIGIQEYFL